MDTDIIIVGDGLAGSTLASLLGTHGVQCFLLGRNGSDKAVAETTPDPRTLAITPASANILQHADAWSRIPRARTGHFRRMQVWDAGGRGEIEFDSAELCEPTLGYIIEQAVLEEALHQACTSRANCRLVPAAGIASFQVAASSVAVSLEDGRQLTARLLVGADGGNSVVRQLAGIAWPRHEYRQQAVAGVVETGLAHAQVARQRFLPAGPLAFLPMHAANQCGFVWSTGVDHAAELLAMDESAFRQSLADAFEQRLGNVTRVLARAGFPLQHAHAAAYCLPRLVLIGDAAHVIHPLAGQGANMGLLDAAVLAQEILGQIQRKRDPGSISVLRRYERWRKGENQLMLRVLQGLNAMYASRSRTLRILRNSGMDLTDVLSPLKHRIMRHAMGLSGDLPDFARRKH